MFSIISVYHNKEILEKNLLKSLKNQTVDYELILVNNIKGRFKSATKALNWGAKQIKSNSKYIMFVHQDIDLCFDTWLNDAEEILDSLPNLGIAGIAGKSGNKKEIITNIKHGVPPKLAGKIQIKKPEKVQTIDECLIIIPRLIFNKLQFNEGVCDNWHLYGVDYCLSVQKLGFDVYVLPMFVYHVSTGISDENYLRIILSLGWFPKEYYQTLKKLLSKYKNSYKQIYTTCGDWNTFHPVILQRILHLARAGRKFLIRKLWNRERK